jgi:diketogulonate reductase-like aldo/keto reductase
VSNFDTDDMEELLATEGGDEVATNQVLYNLARRGIEFDLLPWCRERGIPVMAYSPIDQKRLLANRTLHGIANRHKATPAHVALAWVLRQQGVLAIPKSANPDHVKANRESLEIQLTQQDLDDLDHVYPPPSRKAPLEVL